VTSERGSARRAGGRIAALGVLVCSWFCSTVLTSPAALALNQFGGDDSGPSISISRLKALLLFGVGPVGAGLLIALVVSLPSLARGPRYRPGLGWEGTPEWYGGPQDDEQAQVGGGYGAVQVGRHRRSEALTGRIVAVGDSVESTDGGSSARW
jgi:hypothetical protein